MDFNRLLGRGDGHDYNLASGGEDEDDVDVEAESERVHRSFGEDMISLHRLRKTFSDFVAVDHLSVGIAQNEIFGLLGPNVGFDRLQTIVGMKITRVCVCVGCW